MTKSQNTASALDAFIAKKAEFDAMLERIKVLSGDHFGTGPDEINWGHAGTLSQYTELLKRITDAPFQEGEHAE